jgi:PAS domain S-box-containing protein
MLAEKLWSASVSSLLALLDNSPNGIFICTKEKYLVYVNKAYEQINGLNASDIVGKTLYELVSMGYIETSIGLLVIESKQPTSIIQRLPKINKELLVTANPVFDANNELDLIVGISMDLNKLSQEKWELWRNKNAFSELPHEDTVIAQSAIMRNTLNLTYRAAQSKVSILFLGESGVGKDVLARYTHENGPFRKGPMVSINCAALPSELLESELYGYVKGAFTGAKSDGKPGLFELASGGTLFLDEVGDLPLTLQPKLLRILEERKMRRLRWNQDGAG